MDAQQDQRDGGRNLRPRPAPGRQRWKRGPSPGFTLIELMLVVVILGALAAIALPNFRKFQCRARQQEARMLFQALEKADRIYRDEWGTWFYSGVWTSEPFVPYMDKNAIYKTRYYSCVFLLGGDFMVSWDNKDGYHDPNFDTWTYNRFNAQPIQHTFDACDQ